MRGTSNDTKMMQLQQQESLTSLESKNIVEIGIGSNSSSSPMAILWKRRSSKRYSTSSSSFSWPIVFSVFIWLITLLLVSPASSAAMDLPYYASKEAFNDFGCQGGYSIKWLARLDLVCHDCYQLYRELDIYEDCRKGCCRSDTFNACLEDLRIKDDPDILEMVDVLSDKKNRVLSRKHRN